MHYNGSSVTHLSKKFSIPRRTIYEWINSKEIILSLPKEFETKSKTIKGVRKSKKFKELESTTKWLEESREDS